MQQGTVPVAAAPMLVVIFVLAVTYSACMGSFALWRATGPVWGQLAAATVKTPALFLLTLAATFPSLYVFNALVGSRLNCVAVFRLLFGLAGGDARGPGIAGSDRRVLRREHDQLPILGSA